MENSTLKTLLNRRSVRNFTGEKVAQEDLASIIAAGLQAPTSIGGQQISLVITQDKATIEKIAAIAGNQPQVATADVFITIIIDFNRTTLATKAAQKTHLIEKSAEGIIVGAVDAGIMCEALQVAANSLGYGTTAIGAVRKDSQAMIELLELPQNTFPVLGLTLGVADEKYNTGVKPRVPVESFAMYDKYDSTKVEQGIDIYDKTLRAWYDKQGRQDYPSYKEHTAQFYQQVYFRDVKKSFMQQGFSFLDAEDLEK